jgi:hypothetical protein
LGGHIQTEMLSLGHFLIIMKEPAIAAVKKSNLGNVAMNGWIAVNHGIGVLSSSPSDQNQVVTAFPQAAECINSSTYTTVPSFVRMMDDQIIKRRI